MQTIESRVGDRHVDQMEKSQMGKFRQVFEPGIGDQRTGQA